MRVEQSTQKDRILWNLELPSLETLKAAQGSRQPDLPLKLALLWARGWTRWPSEICSNLNYCVILCKKDRRGGDNLERWNNYFTVYQFGCVWRNHQDFNTAWCTTWALRKRFSKVPSYPKVQECLYLSLSNGDEISYIRSLAVWALYKIPVSTVHVLKNVNHLWNLTSRYQDKWIQTEN